MTPKETIISVVKENWMLRFLCLFLGIGMMVCGFTSYILSKKPALVWVVTQEGRITNSNGLFFDWEANQAAQKAVEIFYTPNSNRENLIPLYFSPQLTEQAKKFTPRDRLIAFQVGHVEHKDDGVFVQGTLLRSGESDEKLALKLSRVERTEENPFGFIVVKSGKLEEKKEEKLEGLSVGGSTSTIDSKK